MCFAGGTMYAYPIMIQLRAAVENHRATLSRAQDLTDLKGHLLRIANAMCAQIHDLPVGQQQPEAPDVDFLFGGYSWKRNKFVLWRLHFDAHIRRFTFRPTAPWKGIAGKRLFAITGDSVPEAKERLVELLRSRNKLQRGGLDMEPFEVLRDMIRDRSDARIGGAPQIIKIYKHMNANAYPVWWPDRASGQITLLGRPLLDYERTQLLVLNPDTLRSEPTWNYDAPIPGAPIPGN